MAFQEVVDAMMKAKRSDDLKTSEQLLLGEMIAKLEGISNKELPVMINDEYEGVTYPTRFDSWRGSYCELALGFAEKPERGHALSVSEFIQMCKNCIGKEFEGYKGGEYVMGKNTPVWIDLYSISRCVAVVDIVVDADKVVLVGKKTDF